MALLRKEFTERNNGHILDVSVNANSFCVQCSVMASTALTRDRVIYYLPRQVKFYSLSFHVIDIERLFQRNTLTLSWKVSFYRIRGLFNNKYLKYGGREPVASKKMTLGQVVPNFTGKVVSSKILRIFRWKLWVNLCSVQLSKKP